MGKILFFLMLLFFSAPAAAQAPASDFYKILGVFPDVSSDKMEEAYRRVKRRLRSKPPGSLESSKRLEELEEAYGALQDPRRRAEYNSWLKKAGFQEEPNFYKLFGVLSDSPPAEITRAYREILQRIHPDKNKGAPEANRRTQELKEAHRVLSDPRLRLKHDRELRSFEGNLLEEPAGEASGKEPSGASAETSPGAASQGRAVKGRAEFHRTAARLQEEESLDAKLFNEEIFQLARELEAAGGEENIREAVSWYRFLAVEGDVRAARRLAPLLEDIDMEEALYRYRQGSADDSDREFSRAAVFREAQLYLKGVYEGDKAVIPKDPKKASALFERAVELGAPREAVAREYDLIRDYEKAMEWQLRKKGQISGAKTEGGKEIKFKENKPNAAPAAAVKKIMSDTPIHKAVVAGSNDNGSPSPEPGSQGAIVKMLRGFEMNRGREIDWSAYNSDGRTALSLAAERWYDDVARFLINRGADPAVPDANGFLPVHRALFSKLYDDYEDIMSARTNLRDILRLFDKTWTARYTGPEFSNKLPRGGGAFTVETISSGETPLDMALRQCFKYQGHLNFYIDEVYLNFVNQAVIQEGVSYLSDEDFDRIIGIAFELGAGETADLLMEKRKSEAEKGASDSGAMKPERPAVDGPHGNEEGWLSRFFHWFFLPPSSDGGSSADKCRDSFPSSKK